MLFALRQPAVFLGLVLGFGVGCFLRATGQRLAKGGLRSAGTGRLAGASAPQRWLDPFGCVAALLGGAGWSPRPELAFRAKRHQVWTMVVIAVGVHAALAVAGLAGYVALGGSRELLSFTSTLSVLHGDQGLAQSFGQRVALGFGVENLVCGLLALLPLPPLELGVALWSTLPRSPASRRLAYRFLEEQWAVAVVLILLIVPLAGEQPLLLVLVDHFSDQILGAL